MSVEALTWAFKVNINNPGAKFVLIALSNYADENGECYPSISHLSRMTSINERTIQNHLDFLETNQLITRGKRRNDDGHFKSNIYQVQFLQSDQRQNLPSDQRQNLPSAKSAHYTKENKEDTKFKSSAETARDEISEPNRPRVAEDCANSEKETYMRDSNSETIWQEWQNIELRQGILPVQSTKRLAGLIREFGQQLVISELYPRLETLSQKADAYAYFKAILKNAKQGKEKPTKPLMSENERLMREAVLKTQEMYYANR
jgi:DNA-binding transcriptional regulator YhcF (GntR family)